MSDRCRGRARQPVDTGHGRNRFALAAAVDQEQRPNEIGGRQGRFRDQAARPIVAAQASQLAQDFAGSAGGLGLTGITAAARALAQGARDGASNDILAKAATDMLDEHHRVSRALRKLYPDLPAETPAAADAA